MIPWIEGYAAFLLNKFEVGHDGLREVQGQGVEVLGHRVWRDGALEGRTCRRSFRKTIEHIASRSASWASREVRGDYRGRRELSVEDQSRAEEAVGREVGSEACGLREVLLCVTPECFRSRNRVLPIRIRLKSGPEARFPARKNHCVS